MTHDPSELSDFAKLVIAGISYGVVQVAKGVWQGWKFKESEQHVILATASVEQVSRLEKQMNDRFETLQLDIKQIKFELARNSFKDDRSPKPKKE